MHPSIDGVHGHVFPRPDGVKARCGGPSICPACALDQSSQQVKTRADKSMAIVPKQLFVVHRINEYDGSGESGIYGIFDSREGAEAEVGRRLMKMSYAEGIEIVECVLNVSQETGQ